MLRHVFFDLYGTLVQVRTDEADPATSEGFARWVGERFGAAAGQRERQAPLAREIHAMRPPPRAHGEPDIGPVIAGHLAALLGRAPGAGELEEAAGAFRDGSRRELSLIPGVLEALAALRPHYGIGMISNAQLLFTLPELRRFGLESLFSPRVISSETGMRKPSAEIFALALARAGVPAGQALHVGNDPLDDLEGGAGAGLRTCLVGPAAARADFARAPDLRLASVADLPARLLGASRPDWA